MTVYGNENTYAALTEREQSVIKALRDGSTYEDVASALNITVDRVKRIAKRASEKIGDA